MECITEAFHQQGIRILDQREPTLFIDTGNAVSSSAPNDFHLTSHMEMNPSGNGAVLVSPRISRATIAGPLGLAYSVVGM